MIRRKVQADSGALRCSDKTHHILIEEVNDHVGKSCVAPVSVNQEKSFQVFEVRYGEITCHHRLRMTKRSQDTSLTVRVVEGNKMFTVQALSSDLHALLA